MDVGLAWYERQDYQRVLDIMEDAESLPATYDEWLVNAERIESDLQNRGHIVVRAMISSDEFVAWCDARGLKVNAQARMQWAKDVAYRQVKGSG
jgi:hypothetical protein